MFSFGVEFFGLRLGKPKSTIELKNVTRKNQSFIILILIYLVFHIDSFWIFCRDAIINKFIYLFIY